MRLNAIFLLIIIVGMPGFSEQNQNEVFEGAQVINQPNVVGNYPNTPFLFAVPTSGKRPVTWSAKGLPAGLQIDPATGIISGSVKDPGTYNVELTAANKLGKSSKILTIKIGNLLALTPPMGWNSWNTFAEQLCDSLVRQVADSMVANGMRDLGYQYVNIDDFWQLKERDKDGNIQVNREKFPNGIKSLADYVHSKGLKLGIYSDAAEFTCGGVAGSNGFEESDAKFWAKSGIDLLKYDYCGAPSLRDTAIARYTRMAKALRKTNRSIVFSVCEWGEGGINYDEGKGNRKPYEWAAAAGGNYWRTTLDIRNTWNLKVYNDASNSIMQILDINSQLSEYAGPGHWNDPDMLVVGIRNNLKTVVNVGKAKGCTEEEHRSHMSLWCLMASPLLCGNDIRNMDQTTKSILLNTEIIAINQDPLGKQAKILRKEGDREVFAKPLADGSIAIGLLNRSDSLKQTIKVNWKELDIKGKWEVRDVWKHTHLGESDDSFQAIVEPHQCIVVKINQSKAAKKNFLTKNTFDWNYVQGLMDDAISNGKSAISHGWTENYNSNLSDLPDWGLALTLIDGRYFSVPYDTVPLIQNENNWFSTENECYGGCDGEKAEEVAKYYNWKMSNLKALQLRMKQVLPSKSLLYKYPDFKLYVEKTLGKSINNTPDVWACLRSCNDWIFDPQLGLNGITTVHNWERWLYQRDVSPDGLTVDAYKALDFMFHDNEPVFEAKKTLHEKG